MKLKNYLIETVETIVVSLIIITLIYTYIASVEVVSGSSMEPNFHTGERILVERITKYFKPLKRGEVVVVIPPTDDRHYIKRVIGIPGDIFKIYGCNIYVSRDGQKFQLLENYLDGNICTQGGLGVVEGRAMRINNGEYLVFGDNRPVSIDSRTFGVVKSKEIIGRVIFRFWPLPRAGFTN
jgi:signal peptidase I